MRRHWTARIAAVAIGALMLAATAPVAVPAATANAAPFAVSQARAFASGGSTFDDEFAQSVAIAGDYLAIGRPGWNADQGRVEIWKRTGTTWAYLSQLSISGGEAGDKFGYSLAMDGTRLVVGAPYRDTGKGDDAGTVRVYHRSGDTWILDGEYSGETIVAYEHYGMSVDVQGDTFVVGAPDDGTAGSAWPYWWNGASWVNEGTIPGSAGDHLGHSVAVAGDTILASATGRDHPSSLVDAGAFVVYLRTAGVWFYSQVQYANDPQAGAGFGAPIAIADSGYTAVIGAPDWDAGAGEDNTGRAYIYTRGVTWSYRTTLANPGANSPDGDYFGSSVAIDDDDLAFVGAFWDDGHYGAGYYYARRAGSWTMAQKVSEMGASPGEALFGDCAAIDNGTLVVGAPTSGPDPGFISGSAFVYSSRARITGICRDAITGLPVAGAEVTAYVLDAWGEPQMANVDSLMVTGSDGRYTLSVDSGTIYLGWMGMIPYQPGWYNDVQLSSEASPVTVWAGNTYNYDFTLYPVGSVFRFYNVTNNTHFFTNSLAEKKHVQATWPTIFRYEGIAYRTNPASNTNPLYRFYNRVSKSHFYTASTGERDHVLATWPAVFQYDGPTFAVSAAPGAGMTPVWRFYNLRNGSHFYTASVTERDMVAATWPTVYRLEGAAYWIGP